MALAHCTLATRDVAATAAFFQATLDWQPIDRPGNLLMGSAWLQIADDQELHLLEVADFEVSPFEREFGRHIAVTWPLEGFGSLRQRLQEHGAELIDAERATPFQRFFFRDPNGYVFEVVESDHAPETS